MCFKITRAQREYYRYQGVSAELERRGYGCSRPELAWANRLKAQSLEASQADRPAREDAAAESPLRKPDSN